MTRAVDRLRIGRARLVLPLVAVISAACNSGDDAGKRPLAEVVGSSAAAENAIPAGLTALAAAHLDSGNVSFRARQYEMALRYYRAAALDVPSHPAPWYGILMVAQATKNSVLADSATQAVAQRSGGGELLESGSAPAHTRAEATPPPVHPAR
ncbi:MAG: hypothetical protein IT353_09215 [Gemmatimonadaceae bacterium]|nr:hypothetical protein [Gemmatimonadaceae bacterium]